MSDVALILRKLRRVRRRLFFVHLINSLSIAVCILAFLAALFSFRGVAWGFSGLTAALTCAAVLMISAVVAFLRTPGMKATAKLVDRKLALQQRLETALECIAPREEVDRLILKDAAQRMAHVVPAAVVPVRFAQFARVAFGAGLITLAGLALIRFLEGWNRGDFIAQRNRPQVAGQTPVQPGELPAAVSKNAEMRPGSSAAAPGFSVAAPDAGSAKRLADASQSQAANPALTSPNPTAQSAGAPGASKEGAAGQAQASQQAQPTHPLASTPAQPASPDRRGTQGGTQTSQAQARPQDRDGDASGPSRSSSGAASIRAATKPDAGSSTAAIGAAEAGRGTKGSAASGGAMQPAGLPVISRPDAAFIARYASEYASYRLAAEQALTREKIPPGFRKYIADYFASIHP
jgi:hypothetical protein